MQSKQVLEENLDWNKNKIQNLILSSRLICIQLKDRI